MEISVIPIEDLKAMLRSEFRTELKDLLSEISKSQHPLQPSTDELIKRSDIAKMFDVSIVTVHQWMRKGVLAHYKMNGRTYFKKSEVLDAMRHVKVRRKTPLLNGN